MDATFTRIEKRQQSILDMVKQIKNDSNQENKENRQHESIACGKGMNAVNILHRSVTHHYR
jgi:hypothetical protein